MKPNGPELVDVVSDLLRTFGIECSRVDTTSRESCDLKGSDSQNHYLIEVKRRLDPDDRSKILRDGRVYSRSQETHFDQSIENSLRKAKSQLTATAQDSDEHPFEIVWLIDGQTPCSEMFFEQVFGTLFGLREAIAIKIGAASNNELQTVWGSLPSRFSRMPNVVAVVAQSGGEVRLCVNPWATLAAGFATSALFKSFEDTGQLIDPGANAERIDCLVADRHYREDEVAELEAYLKSRYGLRLALIVALKSRSAEVAVVPRNAVRR